MAELKLISPLLDHMEIVRCIRSGGGTAVYLLKHTLNNEVYILKHISVPESQTQVDALLFTGAASNEEEAQKYYEQIVADYESELSALAELRGSSNCATYLDYQICPRESGVGFELYLLSEKWTTLTEYLAENAMTHLRALNLGLDLCTALCELRAKGMIHRDIKPENIYLNTLGGFMIGDMGAAKIDQLKYCAMPDRMITDYTAPELTDIISSFNTTVDIYSVGIVLYRILNGNHGPFEDENTSSRAANKLRISGQQLPSPLYGDYELTEIVLKACAFEPTDRYQTPDEMMQDLVRYMKRNQVTDSLIVPPIITDDDITIPQEEEPVEPVRFADVDAMDEQFVNSFTPDTTAVLPTAEEILEEEAANRQTETAAEPEAAPDEAPSEAVPPAEPVPQAAEAPAFAAPRARSYVPEDEPTPAAEAPQKEERKPRVWIPIAVAAALVCIIGVCLYFLVFGGPSLSLSELAVTERGPDFLTVSLNDNGKGSDLSISCTDTYGNVQTLDYLGQPLTFSDLASGAQYTITVFSRGGKRLTGTTTTMASTIATTEIVSFTAASSLAGQAELNLMVSGPDPGEWTIRYSAPGEEAQEVSFSGHNVTVFNLETDKTYTFELLQPEGVVLAGDAKLEFRTGPEIEITDLEAFSTSSTSLKVTWSCGDAKPETWSVSCTAPDGTVKTQTVQECEAEFTELETALTYTITVTSSGTKTPSSVTAVPTAAVISDFTAQAADAGSLRVTWTTAEEAAEWQLLYTIKDSGLTQRQSVQTTDATLIGLVPGQTYQVELRTAAGEAMENARTEVTLPGAQKFQSYGASRFFLGIYSRPAKENWGRSDLVPGMTQFDGAQGLIFGVESLGTLQSSGDAVQVTYSVENAAGTVLSTDTYSAVWDDLWADGLLLHELKDTPQDAGSYTLRLFFNGQSVVAKEFTIQ